MPDLDPFPWYATAPRARAVLEVCQGSACREVGNEELLYRLECLSGLKRGVAAADGSLALVGGICQGRCAIGPNVRLNGCAFSVAGPGQAGELLRQARQESA
jgi:NADH:ubiquinone oxidoreductase subunit E